MHKQYRVHKNVAPVIMLSLPKRSLKKPIIGLPIPIPRFARAPVTAPYRTVIPSFNVLSGSEYRIMVYPKVLKEAQPTIRSISGRFSRLTSKAFWFGTIC